MRQLLQQVIDRKAIYLEFLRSLPSDKRDKVVSDIWRRIDESFDERELERELKRWKVASPAELDAVLRQYGWSRKKLRQSYGERLLAQSFIRQTINFDPNISHDEMLAHYSEHPDEYEPQAYGGVERPPGERQPTGPVSFQEAQAGIRKRLRKERVKSEIQDFVANAREKAPVWTIYDEESTASDIPQR